jgi:hypothetical protein
MDKLTSEAKDFYLVSSFGGCGTTFLIDFISKYKKTNDRSRGGADWLKHTKNPPKLSFIKKAIYIFDKPENTIVYHFSKRDRSFIFWPIHHCRNMEGDWSKISAGWDLGDYLSNGKDLFMFENHFDNWLNSKDRSYQIMFVKYEKMWDHLPEVFDFLEIDKEEIKNFPPKKQRKTNWKTESNKNQEMISKMYGNFSQRIDSFDDIKIV